MSLICLRIYDKLNLKNPSENIALLNLSIYCTWKNIKSAYSQNKFKFFAPTWNGKFDFPDGSYSISDIQYYFEYIIKKQKTIADNPPAQIYTNRIKNSIDFKILSPENNEIIRKYKKRC